jgi:uncharacterized repeat protein (TIGR03803 family)
MTRFAHGTVGPVCFLLAALGLSTPLPVCAQVSQGTFATLVGFTGTAGIHPGMDPTGISLDSSGSLYGVTAAGGTAGDGTLFKYTPGANTFASLASLTGNNGADPGVNPEGAPLSDGQGNLYGTTAGGGTYANGTVYKYTPSTNTFTSLVPFTGNAGAAPGFNPLSGVTSDGQGNLYGTTSGLGTNTNGTVYKYTPGTNTFTNILTFSDNTGGAYPGANPLGGLASDGQGNLFGTTLNDGNSLDGTLFEYTPSTNTFTTLVNFTGTGGNYPGQWSRAALTSDGKGDFFGITQIGGASSDGTLFEYTPSTNTFTNLVQFTGTTGNALGDEPYGSLAIDGAGNLFGTTLDGGVTDNGTVFEYKPGTGTFTTLVQFTGANGPAPGANPTAALVIGSAGTIYGLTDYSGSNNTGDGSLWSLSGVATPAPEPSAWVTLGLGALGLGVLGARTRRRGVNS